MDIGTIDYWANSRASTFHRASAASKLLAAGVIIGAIVITTDIFVLLGIYLLLIAAVIATRLPPIPILTLGLYPAIFALLFALTRWDGSLLTPGTLLLRAVAAATTMLLVVTTTSYPQVLTPLLRVLPGPIGDAFLLTYRSLFILLDLFGRLGTALRLRGGLRLSRPGQTLGNLAGGLGMVLIRSLALSERTWQVLRVRGYRRRLVAGSEWRRLSPADLLALVPALALGGFAVARSLAGPTVAGYNGYLLIVSAVALAAAAVYARSGRRS